MLAEDEHKNEEKNKKKLTYTVKVSSASSKQKINDLEEIIGSKLSLVAALMMQHLRVGSLFFLSLTRVFPFSFPARL